MDWYDAVFFLSCLAFCGMAAGAAKTASDFVLVVLMYALIFFLFLLFNHGGE